MRNTGLSRGIPWRLLLVLVGFLCASIGVASAEWEAQATSKVNLRASPGVDQKILTVLTPGAAVLVTEQQGEWCKVMGKDAPDVQGWVVGTYLKKTSQDGQAVLPLPAQGEVDKVMPEKGMKTPQEVVPPAPESAAEAISPAAGQEGPETKKAEATETTSPSLPKDAPGVGASVPAGVPAPETAGEAPRTAAADAPDELSGLRLVLRHVVQLASVIMSCLALVFSYKAFQLAQECYRAMMRFQLRFQQPQEKAGKSAKE